jgi:hypothetical protein
MRPRRFHGVRRGGGFEKPGRGAEIGLRSH